MPRLRVRAVKRKRAKVKIEPGLGSGAGAGAGWGGAGAGAGAGAGSGSSASGSREPPAKRRRVVATTGIKIEVKKEKRKGKGKGKGKVKREVKREEEEEEEEDDDEDDELMFDCATRRREREGKERREALVGPSRRKPRSTVWDGVSRWKHYSLCLAYARSLNLKSQKEWYAWCKLGQRPENVPYKPEKIYAGIGWSGWGSFLGTGNIKSSKRTFRSFDACRTYARSLELTSNEAWKAWRKVPGRRPADVPSNPGRTYKDAGWTNWGDFLGTGNKVGSGKGHKRNNKK